MLSMCVAIIVVVVGVVVVVAVVGGIGVVAVVAVAVVGVLGVVVVDLVAVLAADVWALTLCVAEGGEILGRGRMMFAEGTLEQMVNSMQPRHPAVSHGRQWLAAVYLAA